MNPTLVFPLSDKAIMHQWPIDYVRLEYKLVDPEARVPYRKRETDAGYDIFSIEDMIIKPHSTENIRTGIIVVCPQGYYYTVEGRSSMWIAGVAPFHGIIDTGYTGQLFVRLMNISDVDYHVKKFDRIAQIILHKTYSAVFIEVDEFSAEYSQRGEAGFGSSGR
jgi:dUTP pyrophosphatase